MICEREFKQASVLATHLRSHIKLGVIESNQDYYNKFLKTEEEGNCQNPKCPKGNPPTTFQSLTKGYSVGCCNSCSQSVPKIKQKTAQSRKDNNTIEKAKTTRENTLMDRYGTDNPMKVKEFKEKSSRNHDRKASQIVREKNLLEKYGVDNVMKIGRISDKQNVKLIENSKDIVIEKLNNIGLDVINYTKCSGTCSLKCKVCGFEFEDRPAWLLYNDRNSCRNCNKRIYGKMENEVYEYCKQYFDDIIQNTRSLLGDRREIDIFIPNINLGIEFNGLYWHSELMGMSSSNHQKKTIDCQEKGIKLLQIFEDEWIEKQAIVKSILKAKMNIIDVENTYYARKCKIINVDNKTAQDFYNTNHIQGQCNGGNHFGLEDKNDGLVALITIAKPRFSTKHEYEILRFCNLLNKSTIGGLSRLIKFSINELNISSLITYADARYSDGSGYLNSGMKYITLTQPGYFYLRKGKRINRINYQKHKLENLLENFNQDLSEWENMKSNGFDRIWDCGNHSLEWIK